MTSYSVVNTPIGIMLSDRVVISDPRMATRRQISINLFALISILIDKKNRMALFRRDCVSYLSSLLQIIDGDDWEGYNEWSIKECKKVIRLVLKEDEYEAIRMRFGLDDGFCRKQSEIIRALGWSFDNYRQNEIIIAGKLASVVPDLKEILLYPLP